MDSLYSTVPTKVKWQIAVLTRTPSPQLKQIFSSVAQQRGGSDCGLYAVANAAAVCAGLDVMRLKYDQNKMRNHLMKCDDLVSIYEENGNRYSASPTNGGGRRVLPLS